MKLYKLCPRCDNKNMLYNGEDKINECYFCGYPIKDVEIKNAENKRGKRDG